MKYVIALGAALVLNACANLAMKIGAQKVGDDGGLLQGGLVGALKSILGSWVLTFGLVCFALNAGLYMFALQSKALKISIAYPIMVGGGYALIALVAYFHPALRESLNTAQKIGVAMILSGILLVSTQSSS